MRKLRLECRMVEDSIPVTVVRAVCKGIWLIAFMEFELLQ